MSVAADHASRHPFHVLHVEDDDLDAMNFQRAIRNCHWIDRVEHAHDGIEALARLRSGELDTHHLVILADIRMPRMNGLELLAQLRADPALRHIPVVVMTTSMDDADLAAAYRQNVAGYLVKSNDRDRFRAAIAAFEEYWSNVALP